MKYKLLQNAPNASKGDIFDIDTSSRFEFYTNGKVSYHKDEVENNPDWFAPIVLTTEDMINIYLGEKCWILNTENSHVFENWVYRKDITEYPNYKYFSSKQAAEKYIEPKFKVGDIVKYKFKFTTVIFKVGEVNKTSIISEDNNSYETLLCTLADSQEIISYYEKLGWVKGAKFKWDKVLYEFTEFNFKRNGELLIMFDKQFGVKIKDCELIRNEYPKSWEDLESVEGWFFDFYSRKFHNNSTAPISVNKNLFKTEKQAESALAYAQLSQLIAEMNGNEELDWENCSYAKFTIERLGSKLCKNQHTKDFKHLAFKTEDARDFSFQHHKNLWEKYWQI